MLKLSIYEYIPIAMALVIMPTTSVIAQGQDVNSFNLALGLNQASAKVIGSTGGAYSLASIVNQDSYGNHCMGYGDPKPDHIMTLENDFSRLRLQVNSGGEDTTLVVRRIDQEDVRCGFGKHHSRDAIVEGHNWKAGKYEIWVGSMKPHHHSNYSLSIQQ